LVHRRGGVLLLPPITTRLPLCASQEKPTKKGQGASLLVGFGRIAQSGFGAEAPRTNQCRGRKFNFEQQKMNI
ncbi:MAG: hypothetical protein RRZ69_03635, partial [Clostridia bacterium]